MKQYFADLHIHVGCNNVGKWIKIPSSSKLTVRNILEEACNRKGLDIVGIADALSPLVQADLNIMIEEGLLKAVTGGGYTYKNKLLLLLGGEIETVEENRKTAHTLLYFPDLWTIQKFSILMSAYIRNINLSCQNAHISLQKLIELACTFDAVIIPAHVFTPYKSLYGACTDRISSLLDDFAMSKVAAIEIGLSADSLMADRISELAEYSLLSNSDAHSLNKIAREYNLLEMEDISFQEFEKALARKAGRKIIKNFGLNPKLGKYYMTHCLVCGISDIWFQEGVCSNCKSRKITKGVFQRIEEIADYENPSSPMHRPPYIYQVPLEYIPGIGTKTMYKLLECFQTEMNILHYVSRDDIALATGDELADKIERARLGLSYIESGAGGIYGKIID